MFPVSPWWALSYYCNQHSIPTRLWRGWYADCFPCRKYHNMQCRGVGIRMVPLDRNGEKSGSWPTSSLFVGWKTAGGTSTWPTLLKSLKTTNLELPKHFSDFMPSQDATLHQSFTARHTIVVFQSNVTIKVLALWFYLGHIHKSFIKKNSKIIDIFSRHACISQSLGLCFNGLILNLHLIYQDRQY